MLGLRPVPRFAGVVGFAVAVNLPWIVPALARPGGVPADPAGVAAFAARSDTPLGLAGSLLTLGGIWNPATVPAGRDSALAVVALVAVLAALVLGLRPVLADSRGLVAAGAGGLVLAAAGALPGLDAVLRAVVVHVPGGGLLRDGQKLLAPAALVVALAAGHAVDRLAKAPRTAPWAVLLAVLPVLALPGLAWGVGGRLTAADYPADWLGPAGRRRAGAAGRGRRAAVGHVPAAGLGRRPGRARPAAAAAGPAHAGRRRAAAVERDRPRRGPAGGPGQRRAGRRRAAAGRAAGGRRPVRGGAPDPARLGRDRAGAGRAAGAVHAAGTCCWSSCPGRPRRPRRTGPGWPSSASARPLLGLGAVIVRTQAPTATLPHTRRANRSVTQVLSDERRTGPRDRGAILISTVVAAVVGGLLALGASLVLVSSASDSNAPPVNKPLITYDQK